MRLCLCVRDKLNIKTDAQHFSDYHIAVLHLKVHPLKQYPHSLYKSVVSIAHQHKKSESANYLDNKVIRKKTKKQWSIKYDIGIQTVALKYIRKWKHSKLV